VADFGENGGWQESAAYFVTREGGTLRNQFLHPLCAAVAENKISSLSKQV
jgi:hypothetical protein